RRDRKTPAALNLCFLMVTFRNTTPAGEAQSKSEADVSLQEPLLLGGTDKRDWRADGWGRPACDRTPCGQRCAGAAGWLWVDCGGPLDATALAGLAWLERIGVGSAANILGLQGLGGAWACRPRVLALRVGYLPGVGSVRGGGTGKREAGGAARASWAGAVCEALLALCGLGICAGVPAARVFPAKAGSDTGSRMEAALATAGLFGGCHVPNPVLMPLAAVWGLIASAVFLRWKNLYPLWISHAILGICIAVSVPKTMDHNMRVGLGYLKYHAPSKDSIIAAIGPRPYPPWHE